jgi:hypothetical protein
MIVYPRGGNVGVAEPLLYLGDIRLVIERVGRRRSAQRVRADPEAERSRVSAHQLVNAVRRGYMAVRLDRFATRSRSQLTGRPLLNCPGRRARGLCRAVPDAQL